MESLIRQIEKQIDRITLYNEPMTHPEQIAFFRKLRKDLIDCQVSHESDYIHRDEIQETHESLASALNELQFAESKLRAINDII